MNFFNGKKNENIKTNLDNTDFEFEQQSNGRNATDYQPDLIDLNYEIDNKITKQEYRTAYPFENSSVIPDAEFLQSLESLLCFFC
jgi:hypothetical protein